MKKYFFILAIPIFLFVGSNNVFANEYDYTDGLLDDMNNIESINVPTEMYDNDLTTSKSASNFQGLTFSRPVNIEAVYIQTGGYYAASITFSYYDETENLIKTQKISQSENGYLDIIVDNVIAITLSNSLSISIQEVDFFGEITNLEIPENIKDLEATPSENTVNLTWVHALEFDSYEIYQDEVLIADDITSNTYEIDGLDFNSDYIYKVVTVLEGIRSEGESVEVTTQKAKDSDGDGIPDHEDEYPDDPENIPPPEIVEDVPEVEDLQIEATPERVDLSWKNPPRYFEKATIYRKTTGTVTSFNINDLNPLAPITVHASEDYEPLFETNGTTFGDLSVNENEEYEYKVTNTFNGMESNGVTVQTTIPKPPLVDTGQMKLPFNVGALISSGNGLLAMIGGFVLLALAFIFVPKIIELIRKSFSGDNTAATATTGARLTERQTKIATGQTGRQPRETREPRQGRI